MHRLIRLSVFFLPISSLFAFGANVPVCSPAPPPGSTSQAESAAARALSQVLFENPGCTTTVSTLCSKAKTDLASLQDAALDAATASAACSVSGVNAARKQLSSSDRDWYRRREDFWITLFHDMTTNTESIKAVSDGTYSIQPAVLAQFLGIPTLGNTSNAVHASTPPLTVPQTANKPDATTSAPLVGQSAGDMSDKKTNLQRQTDTADPANTDIANAASPTTQPGKENPPKPAATDQSTVPPTPTILTVANIKSHTHVTGKTEGDAKNTYVPKEIAVCISATKPDKPASCFGVQGGSANLANRNGSDRGTDYVTPLADQTVTAIVDHALTAGDYVYLSEIAPPTAGGDPLPAIVSAATRVPPEFRKVAPLGAAAVGLDITGASSTDPQPVFLATAMMDIPLSNKANFSHTKYWLDGALRISGMAQPGTLQGNIGSTAAFASYLASAVNANPDKIVQSIDASFGFEWQIPHAHWEPISSSMDVGNFADYGLTKPKTLITLSIISSFGAITPLSASQAQPTIYNLTNQIYNTYQNTTPTTGGAPINFGSNCTGISYSTTPASTSACYVAFVPTDRTHFYRNYQAGLRLKLYGGDYSDGEYRFPGQADITLGQNEYVTGGKFGDPVLHFGGVLPVPRVDAFYIFGAMDVRLSGESSDQAQLILSPATVTGLTLISPGLTTIPVAQPNRDRYRIGFGLDILHLVQTLNVSKKAASGSLSSASKPAASSE